MQQRGGEPSANAVRLLTCVQVCRRVLRVLKPDVSAGPQETLRQCCEEILSSFLAVKEEERRSNRKRKRRAALQAAGSKREIRAASAEESDARSENATEKSVATLDFNAPPDVDADSQDLSAGTNSVLGSNTSQSAHRPAPQPAAERLWPGEELNRTGGPGAPPLSTGFNGRRSDNVKRAEDGQKREGDPHRRRETAGSGSVAPSQPQFHHHIQGALLGKKGWPKSPRTDEAVWAAAALGSLLVLLALAVLHTRLYRHWRTTPSLYWYDPHQDYESVAGRGRWRQPPRGRRRTSARSEMLSRIFTIRLVSPPDVMRRRLRIAKRRSKRSRRQQCVLLPVSSSSDES